MKRWIAGFCAVLLSLSLAGCGGTAQPETTAAAPENPVAGKKVAYIMQLEESDIFQLWNQSAQETAAELGMEYAVFFCDGSDELWRDTIEQCAAAGYDGLLLSHGGQDYAYGFLKDLLERYPELKLVTFDTQFLDGAGEPQSLDGVTQFFQQDRQLAELLLEYICNQLYPEKTEAGEPVNILKVWVGPGYLSAFDRREAGYAAYEDAGLIRTVETIGPSDLADGEASMKEVTAAALAKYQPGEIDAVWCCYDLYANGAYTALALGGYDIPLVSVDLSNRDILRMSLAGSPWMACATTNWSHNGEFGMRVLALELAGDYDAIIDPMTGKAASWLELPATLVTRDMVLGGKINVANLDTVAGEAYTDRSWMPSTGWMARLLGD